jgi:hypothetical protein
MQSQSWLLLFVEHRHELEVAAAIDAMMEQDWTCVPSVVTVKPKGRRKAVMRWNPVLPGCILVPWEHSGLWPTLRYVTGYAHDAAGWPWIIPGTQIADFTQCLSALNSGLLAHIEAEEAKALAKAKQAKKKHKYVTATTQDLMDYARAAFGVDLSGNIAA